MNDMEIIYTISLIFIIFGGIVGFVRVEFDNETTTSTTNTDVINTLNDDVGNSGSRTSVITILFSVLKMFFWTFGDIPWFIDLVIFIPIRLLLAVTIARNIWVGGGG